MFKGTTLVVLAGVALLVGFAAGFLLHVPRAAAHRDYLIRVFDNGSVSVPEASISRKQKNKVAWTSESGARLEIVFRQSEFPANSKKPPFKRMTSRDDPKYGREWLVPCADGTCLGKEISDELPDQDGLKYKYDQIVGGTRSDAWIIIDK